MSGLKRNLTEEEREYFSDILSGKFLALEDYRKADTLYVYLSANQEVRTDKIIRQAWADGKRVAAPQVRGREMDFCLIDSLESMTTGAYGIPEPGSEAVPVCDDNALVLMPGLAFDRNGRRLGYGGGYYDRYLSRHPGHRLVALCYDFQVLDSIPVTESDIPVDLLIPVSGEIIRIEQSLHQNGGIG